MATRQLARKEWKTYFDRMSKQWADGRATVEITGLYTGDLRQARCLPLIGVTYDDRDDVLEIAMEGLDHLVHRPRSIVVSDTTAGLSQMEIVDADGQKQIVKVVEPLSHPRRQAG